jgi:hypothetical protein
VKAAVLAGAIRTAVQEHHEAFVVELLGADAAGVSKERVAELIRRGLLDPELVEGWKIPGVEANLYEFPMLVSRVFDSTPPEQRHLLRSWSLDAWETAIRELEPTWNVRDTRSRDLRSEIVVEKPSPSEARASSLAPEDAPEWLSPNEAWAWASATERAGAYARGLGEQLSDNLELLVLETWDGEEITGEADAELRQERLEQIREATGEAIARHDDPERLALDLMRRTDDWEHNWERLARTEIQGAYNEGRVMGAIEAYGEDARIARVTESGACETCLSLLRDADGLPRVFDIRELIANGTNVGKPRSSWSPSIYPLHPNCRCDTVPVPPGMHVGAFGELLRAEETI